MSAKGVIEFANFVVTHARPGGAYAGLLDEPDAVLPLFVDHRHRKTRGAEYFFHKSDLLRLKDGDDVLYAIAFEFVRVKDLKSEQKYEGHDLITDDRKLPNDAASALGVLILNDHRMAYVGKTAFAPSLESLQSTLRTGARRIRREKIDARVAQLPRRERVAGRVLLEAEIPEPSINLVRFKAENTLTEAISEFDLIKRFELKVIAPNPEDYVSPPGLLDRIHESRKLTKAQKATLVQVNPHGLDKEAVKAELATVPADDHTSVKMVGTSKDKHPLTREDKDISIKETANFDVKEPKSAAKPLFARMKSALHHVRKPHNLQDAARQAYIFLETIAGDDD